MIVITTITSSTGLPTSSIPGDASPGEIAGNILPSVYGGSNFSLTLSFEVKDESLITNYDVLSVSATSDFSSIGLNIQNLSSSTLSISGSVINVFPGEYYRFLLRSGTETNLAPINTADWVTVTGWGIPSVRESSSTYTFDVTYDNLGTTATLSTSSSQLYFWNFDSGLNTFKLLINQGEY